MPSPIAHSSLVLLLWPPLRAGAHGPMAWWRRFGLLGLLLAALVAPDFDIALNLILGRSAFATHGEASHSLLAGAVFAAAFAVVGRLIAPISFIRLAAIGLLACWSHVLMDAATRGRGVALLWPITDDRIGLPVPLFIGVFHGAEEWRQWHLHALTLGTESLFAAAVWLVGVAVRRRRAERPRAERMGRELPSETQLEGSPK